MRLLRTKQQKSYPSYMLSQVLKRPSSRQPEKHVQVRANIAASFQRVAVFHICQRVTRAVEWAREVEPSVSTLVVAGGVASNQSLRSALDAAAAEVSVGSVYPPVRLCTDNGATLTCCVAGLSACGMCIFANAQASGSTVYARQPLVKQPVACAS